MGGLELPEVLAASGAVVASASRQGALANPKPHPNTHHSVKEVLQSVLERIQRSTDSHHKPMLSDEGASSLVEQVWILGILPGIHHSILYVGSIEAIGLLGQLRELVASGADTPRGNTAVSCGGLRFAHSREGTVGNGPSLDGIWPLMRAVEVQSRTLVALLLDHALPGYSGEAETFTPLHTAALLPSNTIRQLILRKGANVNAQGSLGQTPLHRAVIMRRVEVASSLISAGAYIEARDAEQRTSLLRAVRLTWCPWRNNF